MSRKTAVSRSSSGRCHLFPLPRHSTPAFSPLPPFDCPEKRQWWQRRWVVVLRGVVGRVTHIEWVIDLFRRSREVFFLSVKSWRRRFANHILSVVDVKRSAMLSKRESGTSWILEGSSEVMSRIRQILVLCFEIFGRRAADTCGRLSLRHFNDEASPSFRNPSLPVV